MNSPVNSTGYPSTGVAANVKIQFTPEEIAVMKECNREGFYNRGVPCTAVFAAGAYYALKTGFLKPHVKYGSLPAIAIGGFIGLLTGSLSYKTICVQRVLALPNGTLRKQIDAVLQQQKPIIAEPGQYFPERMEDDTEPQMISGTQMESYSSTNSFDGFTGVDIDSDQPAKFNTVMPLGKLDGGSQSYDELRRRNREDYIRSTTSRLPQESADPRSTRPQTRVPDESPRFDRDRVPQYQLVD